MVTSFLIHQLLDCFKSLRILFKVFSFHLLQARRFRRCTLLFFTKISSSILFHVGFGSHRIEFCINRIHLFSVFLPVTLIISIFSVRASIAFKMGFSVADGDGGLSGGGSTGRIFGKGGTIWRGVEISALNTFPSLSAEFTKGLFDLGRVSATVSCICPRTSCFRFSKQGAQIPFSNLLHSGHTVLPLDSSDGLLPHVVQLPSFAQAFLHIGHRGGMAHKRYEQGIMKNGVIESALHWHKICDAI